MYHVTETGITAILFYSISYLFFRAGIYSRGFHRKLWNTILAVAFLATAIAGVFLALQVTYKWNIPFVKTILKWHVEFGIGMALTGIFHFLWHFSYYTGLFRKEAKEKTLEFRQINLRDISTNLFIAGFVSSSVQFLLLREILNITGGYELITGTFLGSWLMASAAGASLAGKSDLNDIRKINIAFTTSPAISLILLLTLARVFPEPGQTPSFLVSLIYTFLVLIPFCLISGFTFVKLLAVAKSTNDFIPGKSFSIETVGGIFSGILISSLTSGILNSYQILLIIIVLANVWVLLTFYRIRRWELPLKIITVFIVAFIIIFNIDIIFRQILLPAPEITSTEDTPYGNITTGIYRGEESTYYNQRLLKYSNDAVEREENIHYAMLQGKNPEKIILVSGSLRSHLPEILKYPVRKITYIERDPALTKNENVTNDTISTEIRIENDDAFRYIRQNGEKADVILLLLPPPSTLLLNRYYTTEFFRNAKKRMNDEGILMCTPGPGDLYMNEESVKLCSSVFNSMKKVFANVLPISGNKLYFIASDAPLSTEICRLVTEKNINNIYVGPDYLSDDLIRMKTNEVISVIDPSVPENTSFHPVATFNFQDYNFSKNIGEKTTSLAVLVILFAIPVFTVRRKNYIMYFGASALAGFEIIILFSVQIIIGNMYQLTGLIIAALMAGLAAGSGIPSSLGDRVSLRIKSIVLILFYTVFGLMFKYLINMKGGIPSTGILLISAFIPGMLTGNIFRNLTMKSVSTDETSRIYNADLAGSALGFILISGIAVPVLGISASVFIIASLILAGLISTMATKKI
jgi:spermidine synthase